MDLLNKINSEIKTYCKDNHTSFKVLDESDVISYCISVVKQRVYNKETNRLGRQLVKQMREDMKNPKTPNKLKELVDAQK